MSSESRFRWVIFTSSVISPVDNPDAHLWRSLGKKLQELGHDAIFYELRGNDAFRALLQQSGSRALHEFRLRYPQIEYRTLERKSGAELVEWMTRTLATADVALIQSTASRDLIEWLAKLTRPHLRTFFVDSGWNSTSSIEGRSSEVLIGFSAVMVGNDQLADQYGPAISPAVPVHSFGPLPRIDPAESSNADVTDDLDAACERIIEIVTKVVASSTTVGNDVVGPNGRHP